MLGKGVNMPLLVLGSVRRKEASIEHKPKIPFQCMTIPSCIVVSNNYTPENQHDMKKMDP